MNNIINSVLVMVGLSAGFAVLLSLAYRYFKTEDDPRIKKVEEILPGINCGACGFASCHVYAEHVVETHDVSVTCIPGGNEVSEQIGDLLGIKLKSIVKLKAVIHCGGTNEKKETNSFYKGVKTCSAAQLIRGGFLACEYGCLGLGDCKRICPVDAIRIVDGLAIVDIDICIGCGKCIDICPRNLISLEKIHNNTLIKITCNSLATGKEVRKVCKVGCIACRICEKKAPDLVFTVKDNLSRIDYKKAENFNNWEQVIQSCPTKCIGLDKLKKGHVLENSKN